MAVITELYLNGAWVNISSYVRQDPGHTITFGVQGEGATADANTNTVVVNNTDGRFTPRNPSGAYYPHLKRNTPLRITVGSTVRYCGEIAEYRPTWDPSGNIAVVTLSAAGILRRLQHASNLDATLTTAVIGLYETHGDITGYWPCEDAPGSTSIASALPGGTPGTFTGSPVFAAVDLGVGTHNVPTWDGATATFTPAAASSTSFTAGFYVQLPATGVLTGGEELFRANVTGTAQSWRVLYSPGSGGGLFLQVIDYLGTEILATSPIAGLDGTTHYVKIEAVNDGADVDYAFTILGVTFSAGTITTDTVGAPVSAQIGAGTIALVEPVAIGHVILAPDNAALFYSGFDNGLDAYVGESIEDRLARLATENDITITVQSGAESPIEMGAQPDGTLLEVLRAAEKADAGGILRDAISEIGLAYITRNARYNDTTPQLVLDYAAGELVPPLDPVDDDQQIRNDVKVNRAGGSSARASLESGALSILDYPNGVGPYPFEDTYAVYADTQLPYLADWVLALGTVDETRFPSVTVDLIANPGLVTGCEAVRPGYRLRLENLPAYAGVSDVDLQVIGWTERITKATRTITYVCTPGDIWGSEDAGGFFELNDAVFGELNVNRLAY